VPLYTADALILRTYKLGEADRIVVFLTRDRGKKRGVAKGARRQRSRFVGALEPLTEVRVAYFESERRELVGLNYAETVRSPLAMCGARRAADGPREGGPHVGELDGPPAGGPYDDATNERGSPAQDDRGDRTGDERGGRLQAAQAGDALGYVSYFAELIDEWAQDADADDRLYRLGASMLEALAAGAPVEPLARYFEYWLLRLQGVYPESRGTLSAAAVAFLAGSRVVPPHRIADVPVENRVLRELENVHRALIATHLEKTLRSERVLRDLRRHA
jgi:recombinational DNA repair protein (RecF pathway)